MEAIWLYDLMALGRLVDNQVYQTTEGTCTAYGRPLYQLIQFEGSRRSQAWHYDHEMWRVLQDIANWHYDKNSAYVLRDASYEHNTEDPLIRLSGRDVRNFRLETGNLVGFVKQGAYSLKISSRFGDDFLKYIIADADGFLELKDKGGEQQKDDYAWLLAYFWNIKFKRACRLGLPKQYVSRNERLSKPRGNLDIVDFFQNAQTGRYACRYREHSYQNDAVSLMIAAYEAMKGKYGPFIESSRPQYRAFVEANAGLRRSRRELLATPHFTNPFYSDYNTVIDLSKRFLLNQSASFGESHNSSAFLFDVSMLFEYFIRKLLQRAGITLLPKSSRDHRIPTGSSNGYTRDLQPDILIDHDGLRYVFDVKYKSFDYVYGAKREDLFQLHTYLGQFSNDGVPVRACGLIYPIHEDRWQRLRSGDDPWQRTKIRQQGQEVDFFTMFLRIPEEGPGFARKMHQRCNRFIEQFVAYLERVEQPKREVSTSNQPPSLN
jgi:5-methylcytosine-specific restriction endonuclease McrBC regulatory subunit McrC